MAPKGRDTRQDIIERALQLFSVRGYHNTSVNDLLAATGLTKGGLYGHFGSKEEIWNAAYDRAVEIWQEIAFRGLREVKNPLERVQRLIEQDLGEYVGGRVFEGGCFFLNLLVELSGQEPAMAARILKGFDAFAKRLEGWFAEARQNGALRPEADPREMAEFLVTALNGAAALFAARPEPAATERTLRHLEHYVDSWRA